MWGLSWVGMGPKVVGQLTFHGRLMDQRIFGYPFFQPHSPPVVSQRHQVMAHHHHLQPHHPVMGASKPCRPHRPTGWYKMATIKNVWHMEKTIKVWSVKFHELSRPDNGVVTALGFLVFFKKLPGQIPSWFSATKHLNPWKISLVCLIAQCYTVIFWYRTIVSLL